MKSFIQNMTYILFLVIENFIDVLEILKLRRVSKTLQCFIDSDLIQDKIYNEINCCSIPIEKGRREKIKSIIRNYVTPIPTILDEIHRLCEFLIIYQPYLDIGKFCSSVIPRLIKVRFKTIDFNAFSTRRSRLCSRISNFQ